jgi:hypothetical protein
MQTSADILIRVGTDASQGLPPESGWQGWAIHQIHILPKRGDSGAQFESLRGHLSHEIKMTMERPNAGWHVVEGVRAEPQRGAGKPHIRFSGLRRASPLEVDLFDPAAARQLVAEMQEEIARLRGAAMLAQDPNLVADGMRSGRIAKPSWHEIEKLYPDEVAEVKSQGVNAAADEIQAIYKHEGDDDGIDLWTAGEIIRAKLSPKGWPALGIRPRPMDWDRREQGEDGEQDHLVATSQPESTGILYEVFYRGGKGIHEVNMLPGQRYASEDDAFMAAEEHHQSQLLKDLERDVLGGERTALKWLMLSLRSGQQKGAVAAMVEDLTENLREHMGVDLSERGGLMAPVTLSALQSALKAILAQGEFPGTTYESEKK